MKLFFITDNLGQEFYVVATTLNNAIIKFNSNSENRILAIHEITSKILIGE